MKYGLTRWLWEGDIGGATTLSVGAPTTATLMPQANTVGMNLRPGDDIYREAAGDATEIDYIGKVLFSESPHCWVVDTLQTQ